MKVILYMAISVNGYITNGDDDSDWVSDVDWHQFDQILRESKIMVMGKRTYEYFGDDFPCEGALNVVMTHDTELLKKEATKKALFTDKSPQELISYCQDQGYSQLMLIGGQTLNTSFLQENLIDEVWLSVHPIFIGKGKRVVEETPFFKDLVFQESKILDEGLVQLRYKLK